MRRFGKMRTLLSVMLTVCMLLAFTACGGGTDDSNNNDPKQEGNTEAPAQDATTPQYGGTLTVWQQEFFNDLDPGADARVGREQLWYETLWAMNWASDDTKAMAESQYLQADMMMGQIAKSWEADFDAATFTVTIRDDVKFQDKEPYGGRALVANDIKWSYDRLIGTGSGYTEPYTGSEGVNWPVTLYMIESIDTPDDTTVVFNLKKDNDNDASVNDLMVAEVRIAGPEWDDLSQTQKSDWHFAAGTGPWVLDEYVLDNYMRFVKNPNYYGHDERNPENKLPYADECVLQVISESSNRLTQFIAGEVDILSGTNPLNKSELAQLASSMDKSAYWMLKKPSGAVSVGLKSNNKPFQDINVRKALQYAINTAEISNDYYKIEGAPVIMGLFNSATPLGDPASWGAGIYEEYTTYDPEKAKQMLADAGYPDGFEFTVVIFGALDQDLFALGASYLSQVGVTMKIEVAGNPMEMDQIGADKDDPRCIFKNAGFSTMDFVTMQWISDSPRNATHWNDKEFDALVMDTINAPTIDLRIEAAHKADAYFASQHWTMNIGGAEQQTDVYSTRMGGCNGEQWPRTLYSRVWLNS